MRYLIASAGLLAAGGGASQARPDSRFARAAAGAAPVPARS